MAWICVEINGVFYETLSDASKAVGIYSKTLKHKCLSDEFPDYKITPYRVTYKERKCVKCGEAKLLEEFNRNAERRDGFRITCRACEKKEGKKWREDNPEHSKGYYQDNREKTLANVKIYTQRNIEKVREYRKTHREENKEELAKKAHDIYWEDIEKSREKGRAYRKKNAKAIKKQRKEYREKNKERLSEEYQEWYKDNPDYHKGWQKEKKKNDPMFKLNSIMRSAINRSLKGKKNGAHWETIAGYTCEELKAHLEKQFLPGMTWENHGKGEGKWNIDHHPIPLYWFVFKSYKDKGFKKAWALENLRPMWSKPNIAKGNKLFHP